MKLSPETAKAISESIQRIQGRSAFFSSLALFAPFEASEQIPTAATDGAIVFVNEQYFAKLTPDEQDGLLAHEVLHAALLHIPRCGGRDPKLWNIAADIVINGMLIKDGYHLPKGGLRDLSLERFSTEEVYEQLLQKKKDKQSSSSSDDLLPETPSDAEKPQSGQTTSQAERHEAMKRHWQQAQQQAQMQSEGQQIGTGPGGFARELDELKPGKLDWRSVLWRFLVQTPNDFLDFDRRFIGQGMYLETIGGESVTVLLGVDTSGSISRDMVNLFLSEVQGILRSYPHLRCNLYYTDTKVYGPHRLTAHSEIPPVKGGGGTDFRPFFKQIPQHRPPWQPSVAIYMTDGFGTFPKTPPNLPVLWVVTPGGYAAKDFPFGQVVVLLPHS